MKMLGLDKHVERKTRTARKAVFLFFSYPPDKSDQEKQTRVQSHWHDVVLDRLVSFSGCLHLPSQVRGKKSILLFGV